MSASAVQTKGEPGMSDPWNTVETFDVSALYKADILLVDSSTWASRGIRIGTWSYVSHVALLGGADHVIEALGEGIVNRSTATFKGEITNALVLRHADVGSNADLQNRICTFAEGRAVAKIPYDWDKINELAERSVSSRAYRRWQNRQKSDPDGVRREDDAKFICSEFVARCYEEVGVHFAMGPSAWLAPGDFVSVTWGGHFVARDPKLTVIGKMQLG